VSRTVTILFSSAGRRVELIRCFQQSAAELGIQLRCLATDANAAMCAAAHVAEKCFPVPLCRDPKFIPELLRICEENKVRMLVPTIDPELEPLAAHRDDFQRIGTHVVLSKQKLVRIARNKAETARFVSAAGIRAPRTALLVEALREREKWNGPVILKEIDGSSSVGVHHVKSLAAVEVLGLKTERYVVQEYWAGKEYTVNLFFDEQRLRCAIPYERVQVRSGEVSKGITRRFPEIVRLAEALGTMMAGQAYGPICAQAILNEAKEAAVIEINARFGGGYPLAHQAGARFARWLLELHLGVPCSANNDWEDNLAMLRYDAAMFVPNASGSQ
jgi:carbamoyl-phosphate synthase large subunit